MDFNKISKTYTNPIIPGFYPDPSICRVGDDYYLVNSSFEFFPAIPIWHSKDLVHWEQIGNAIDREEQGLRLNNVNVSGGVQACTIRYNDGTFYITSTCVEPKWPSNNYNFIVTAKDPKGPWSKVHYLDNAPGIDSSLFFDNGKAYYHANCQKIGRAFGDMEIWIQEIDLENFKLVGDRHRVWDGCGGIHPEGPHIYKRNGYYYLLIAEGGTGYTHTVTMAKSKNVFGPYKSIERNPILSHKHLNKSYGITATGHADLVETQNGDWYMVCLATRSYYKENSFGELGDISNLGRESFMVPMIWDDDDGPKVDTPYAVVEFEHPFPNLKPHILPKQSSLSLFETKKLEYFWNTIRNQKNDFFEIDTDKKQLIMQMSEHDITEDLTNVSWIGRRQTSWIFDASTKLTADLDNKDQSGITCFYNYKCNIKFYLTKEDGKFKLNLSSIRPNKTELQKDSESNNVYVKNKSINPIEETLLKSIEVNSNTIYLKVFGEGLNYNFYYAENPNEWIEYMTDVDGSNLNPHTGHGHTGSYVAMFGYSPCKNNNNVRFDYFEYSDYEK